MPARRWLFVVVAALAALAVVFLATGGVYRTVNAGGVRARSSTAQERGAGRT